MDPSPGSLDANVLLRLLLRDIPSQSELALALLARPGAFHVADTAIIETVFALERYYEIPRVEIAAYMLATIGNPKLNVNKELFTAALELYPEHSKLSFEDCCLAIYARLNASLPLWTFDKKLANQLKKYAKLL